MKKLIFLDVDGVLNSENFFRARMRDNPKPPREDMIEYLSWDIDPACIKRLQEIVDRTGADIILSSTWRINHYKEFIKILKRFNVTAKVIDRTPRINWEGSVRGNEIALFIKKNAQWCGSPHKYKNYVIIDDSSDMLFQQKDNFVHTSWEFGLQDRDVRRSVEILNAK